MYRARRNLLLLFVFVLALAGCGSPAVVNLSQVSGEIVAAGLPDDAEFSEAGLSPQALIGQVAVAGAKVQALRLPGMDPIGSTATTDENGKYTISDLPTGVSVVIIATKDYGDKQVRLSTYVDRVARNTSADVDVTTSIVTEMLRQKMADNPGYQFDQTYFEEALQEAAQALEDLDDEDFSVLVGDGIFGDVGLDEAFVDQHGLDELLPREPDLDISAARRAVREVRSAVYALGDSLDGRIAQHTESINNDVVPYVEYLAEAIGHTIAPLLMIVEVPGDGTGPSGPDLGEPYEETGFTYQGDFVFFEEDELDGLQWLIDLIEELTDEEIDRSTIPKEVTLRVTSESGSEEAEVPGADYEIVASLSYSPDEEADSGFAIGVELTGTFNDDRMEAPATITNAAGVWIGDSEFLIDWNGEIDTPVGYVRGDFSLEFEVVGLNDDPIGIMAQNADEDDHLGPPLIIPRFAQIDGEIKLPTVRFEGVAQLDVDLVDDDLFAARLTLYGLLKELRDDAAEFSGVIEAEWDQSAFAHFEYEDDDDWYLNGSIKISGYLKVPEEPLMRLDATITIDSEQESIVVDPLSIDIGGEILKGRAIINACGCDVDVKLQSQSTGLYVSLVGDWYNDQWDVWGWITKGENDEDPAFKWLADIQLEEDGLIWVHYFDGTSESL